MSNISFTFFTSLISDTSHNKTRIAKQFSRAANTYNSAIDALAFVPGLCKVGLDLGCGAGRISQHLAARCDKLVAMD
jgi:malonyl-CoA O-methyltransferase